MNRESCLFFFLLYGLQHRYLLELRSLLLKTVLVEDSSLVGGLGTRIATSSRAAAAQPLRTPHAIGGYRCNA